MDDKDRLQKIEERLKQLECSHPQEFIEYMTAAPNIPGQHHRKCNLCGKSLGLIKVAEVIEYND